MEDETESISRKTWSRSIEPVNKVAYMDGAADGQQSVYQSSFDMGYQQGFQFGFQLGLKNAILKTEEQTSSEPEIRDTRRINCQICVNVLTLQQNVGNLYNMQQEKNNELLKQLS